MVEVRPSLTHISEGIVHTIHISRGKGDEGVLKTLVSGGHMVVYTITIVLLKNKRLSLGIVMPNGNLHSLQYKIILYVASSDLVEFLQFALQPFSCATLHIDRYNQEHQYQQTDAPLQDKDPRTITISV